MENPIHEDLHHEAYEPQEVDYDPGHSIDEDAVHVNTTETFPVKQELISSDNDDNDNKCDNDDLLVELKIVKDEPDIIKFEPQVILKEV